MEGYCRQCKTGVLEPGPFCSKCGAKIGPEQSPALPPPRLYQDRTPPPVIYVRHSSTSTFAKFVGLAILGVVLLVIFAVIHESSNSGIAGDQSAASVTVPADEAMFIEAIQRARNESRGAENDMQKGGIKARRDRSICALLTSLVVRNWVGTVKTIDSNSDGKGVLGIEVAPDVTVTTWNNELSDMLSNTLMQPGSAVFESASAMKTGQVATFSGRFFRDPDGGCLLDSSMTLDGKMEDPSFIFSFLSVTKYDPSQQIPVVSQDAESKVATPAEQDHQLSPPPQPENPHGGEEPPAIVGENSESAAPIVYKIGGAVSAPVVLHAEEPEFPTQARLAKTGGTVTVDLDVDENGNPRNVHAVRTMTVDVDGHASSAPVGTGADLGLEGRAVEAVQKYRFKPSMRDGVPVTVEMNVEVNFKVF